MQALKWNNDKQSIASDLRWRPSPVPKQIGRSSYVDPHQLALAINASHVFIGQTASEVKSTSYAFLPRIDRKDPKRHQPVIDEFLPQLIRFQWRSH